MHPARALFGLLAAVCLSTSSALAADPPVAPAVPSGPDLTILVLSDSMGLCGFAQHLDDRLRGDPHHKAVYTYSVCGTIPTSWLKRKPYLDAKSLCGYLAITGKVGDDKPERLEDIYGMTKGHKPVAHPIPKAEDLFEQYKPDILIIQTGNNLFDIFRDQKSVDPQRHAAEMEGQVTPFIDFLKTQSSLRRVYWVSPPISGRVSDEIQQFVFEHVTKLVGNTATIIDSRPYFTFPYKHMEADKEHFIGSQMDEWADKVYDDIKKDMTQHPLSAPGALVEATSTPAPSPAAGEIHLSATLVSKSRPMETKALLPYRESLVAYLYDVRSVKSGDYREKQIIVMHPAHIDLKPQPLDKFKEGEVYTLRLHEIAGTQWESTKSADETGRIDLTPYIEVEDEARFPKK